MHVRYEVSYLIGLTWQQQSPFKTKISMFHTVYRVNFALGNFGEFAPKFALEISGLFKLVHSKSKHQIYMHLLC